MPKDLPAVARKIWKETVARLERYRLLGEADSYAIERYARTMAQWRAAVAEVEELGCTVTTETKHGERVFMRPAAKTMTSLELQLVRLEDRLGLSPIARQHLRAEQPASEDELAEFLDDKAQLREAAGG